jgi:hypothetical protein
MGDSALMPRSGTDAAAGLGAFGQYVLLSKL